MKEIIAILEEVFNRINEDLKRLEDDADYYGVQSERRDFIFDKFNEILDILEEE